MISPVSFSSTTSVSTQFKDKLQQPQKYSLNDTAAASKINDKTEKKGSAAKKVLLAIAGIGAAAGALVLASKFNVFAPKEGAKPIINTVKSYLDNAAKFIMEKGSSVVNIFKKPAAENVEKVEQTVEEVAEKVAEKVKQTV